MVHDLLGAAGHERRQLVGECLVVIVGLEAGLDDDVGTVRCRDSACVHVQLHHRGAGVQAVDAAVGVPVAGHVAQLDLGAAELLDALAEGSDSLRLGIAAGAAAGVAGSVPADDEQLCHS